MPKGFLPVQDQALRRWAESFAQSIQQPPADSWLSPQRVTAFVQAFEAYAAALARCTPADRSPSVTAAKNAARAVLRRQAGECSKFIQANPDVTSSQKLELGLNVRKPPTRIGLPDEAPWPEPSMAGRRLTVKLTSMVARRGKPKGVAGARIYGFVGDEPPADQERWPLLGTTTTTAFEYEFGSDVPPGTPIWVAACWFNPRTECGPTSEPRQTWIQFSGGPQLARGRLAA